MTPIKINHKITGFSVKQKDDASTSIAVQPVVEEIKPDELHENVPRPDMLLGSTYKIKTPQSEHSLYITINDIILNQDTPYESRRPYEVFINSKNMEHFQWVLALTRVISAVFRKGGDVTFLVEELKHVFDPKGGYFKKGGIWMPSLVAEIGSAIENHMKIIGLIKTEEMSEHQLRYIEQKKQQALARENISSEENDSQYPKSAVICPKCNTKALVHDQGCEVCLSCSFSKCS